ncbi:MAG: response regulator transcription factor [Mameliella sp.]|nr:response regulator transcription factor [Phaeodactylibacter sp.]
MNNIKLLIVDDEPLAHPILEKHAKQIDYLEVVGSCFDAVSTINFLNTNAVDALLLDIQMPDLSGIELIETLEQSCPKVIFTTAYTEYALESFNYEQVIDYLHKPIRLSRFIKSMERLKNQLQLEQKYTGKGQEVKVETTLQKDHLTIKDSKVIYKIPYDEIEYIQSWGNYVKIFKDDTKVQLARKTFKELEEELPGSIFQRIHKSYIVNVKKVKALDGNRVLLDAQTIPIGKSYVVSVKKRLI